MAGNRKEAYVMDDDKKQALHAATIAIACAAQVLKPHAELFAAFEKELRDMENFGHIINPTFYRSSERRAAAALIGPVFDAAARLVAVYDRQAKDSRDMLDKVKAE
jgi:hypothetical protein